MSEETQIVAPEKNMVPVYRRLVEGLDAVKEQTQADIEVIISVVLDELKSIKRLKITSTTTLDIALSKLKLLKVAQIELNARRLNSARPLKNFGEMMKREVDKGIDSVGEIRTGLEGKINVYRDKVKAEHDAAVKAADDLRVKQEADRLKEEERRRKISKAHGGTGENITPVTQPPAVAEPAPLAMKDTTPTRKNWHVLPITGQEHLIPREYLSVSQVKLNKAVCHKDGVREIPGCTIWDTDDIVSR